MRFTEHKIEFLLNIKIRWHKFKTMKILNEKDSETVFKQINKINKNGKERIYGINVFFIFSESD